jgi:UDP-N-acetyl-D-mannosaminuronate dehydrogenase
MTDLDCVVLGGGGHVGLPLSLVLGQAGLRVGIYDTNAKTIERIARGEMPFMERGAPSSAALCGLPGAWERRFDHRSR